MNIDPQHFVHHDHTHLAISTQLQWERGVQSPFSDNSPTVQEPSEETLIDVAL